MTEIRTLPGGTIKWSRDASVDDSDKNVLTVPTGKICRLLAVYVSYVSSADAGNRKLAVSITNGANEVSRVAVNYNHAASTTIVYELFPTAVAQTSATPMSWPLMDVMLPAGYVVRVYDQAAIAAAADDMTTAICYVEYDA